MREDESARGNAARRGTSNGTAATATDPSLKASGTGKRRTARPHTSASPDGPDIQHADATPTSGTSLNITGKYKAIAAQPTDAQPATPGNSAPKMTLTSSHPRITAVQRAVRPPESEDAEEADAVDAGTSDAPAPRRTGRPSRVVTTARPLSQLDPEQRALAARRFDALSRDAEAEWDATDAFTPGDTPTTTPTAINLPAMYVAPGVPALPDDEPTSPVVLVRGSNKPVALWRGPRPSGRPRTLIGGAVAGIMVVMALIGVLAVVSPTSAFQLGQRKSSGPAGARIDRKAAVADVPSGPWDTSTGASSVLGLGGGAAPGVNAPGSAGFAVQTADKLTPTQRDGTVGGIGVQPAPLSPWPPLDQYHTYPPGYGSFGVDSPNGFYAWAFGQCTWWAQYKRQDENLTQMGNALVWADGAAGRGYAVGDAPQAGATVVFQPGIQGAGGAGHVAHVEVVYPSGWFLMSEMNFYWNGGGWGRVDYRYAHSGWGVRFIY